MRSSIDVPRLPGAIPDKGWGCVIGPDVERVYGVLVLTDDVWVQAPVIVYQRR